MILVQLAVAFFLVGLFSVGGGLATIPFLQDMAVRTGWFTQAALTTMIAVSESTPGPIGINIATYVGYTVAGIPGAILAPLSLTVPAFVVILIVFKFLQKFRTSKTVEAVFYGLRPASVGLVAAAGLSVAAEVLLTHTTLTGNVLLTLFHWKSLLIFLGALVLTQFHKIRKMHPILFIGASAVAGILLQAAGS